MKQLFESHTEELKKSLEDVGTFHSQVEEAVRHMREAFHRGHKVLIAGNGGSAAQALHLSDELLGKYREDRRPYPAVALVADTAAITCIGNDYGYEHVFRRQVEALGKQGDVFIGLSTSGTSKNIVLAAEQAQENGMSIISLTGRKGTLREMADVAIESPSDKSAIVQEFHLHAIHLLCEAFEEAVDTED